MHSGLPSAERFTPGLPVPCCARLKSSDDSRTSSAAETGTARKHQAIKESMGMAKNGAKQNAFALDELAGCFLHPTRRKVEVFHRNGAPPPNRRLPGALRHHQHLLRGGASPDSNPSRQPLANKWSPTVRPFCPTGSFPERDAWRFDCGLPPVTGPRHSGESHSPAQQPRSWSPRVAP